MVDQSSEHNPLYKIGIWIAEPVKEEFYSPGAIFIRSKSDEVFKVPRFLGEGCIPDIENLCKLIDIVSQEMIKALPCERVYLVSLGESTDLVLHFRLPPRYQEDQRILDEMDDEVKEKNDGLALMAIWRKQFLVKKKCMDHMPLEQLRKAHEEAIEKVRASLDKRTLTAEG
jgi:hypothetical protein